MCVGFHAWILGDLIFDGSGQNLSILNVASLISFIISLVMSVAMLKNRLWFLLPVVYSFAAINLTAATFLPSTFIKHLENDPKLLIHFFCAVLLRDFNHWCAIRAATGVARPQAQSQEVVGN